MIFFIGEKSQLLEMDFIEVYPLLDHASHSMQIGTGMYAKIATETEEEIS